MRPRPAVFGPLTPHDRLDDSVDESRLGEKGDAQLRRKPTVAANDGRRRAQPVPQQGVVGRFGSAVEEPVKRGPASQPPLPPSVDGIVDALDGVRFLGHAQSGYAESGYADPSSGIASVSSQPAVQVVGGTDEVVVVTDGEPSHLIPSGL